eukprot:138733_1
MDTAPNAFDFEVWISHHKLSALYEALNALQFNNLSALLSVSEPLIDFILSSHKSLQSLDLDEKNKLKLLFKDALQSLKSIKPLQPIHSSHSASPNPTNGETSSHNNDTFLVITSEENNVLQSLKNKLKSVDEYDTKFKSLQKQYDVHKNKTKKQCTKEMQHIDQIINNTFQKLHQALDTQHKALLNQSNTIKQSEFTVNNDHTFNTDIQQCFNALNMQKEQLANSIHKYKNIMAQSTQSSSQLLEFDYDLTERSSIISNMGSMMEKQFSSATAQWDDIVSSMNHKFQTEFQAFGHWTFVMSDVMKELTNNEYNIGVIHKMSDTDIIDVDWIDNGSLVLYIQSPLVYDDQNTENINNLQLKQYKIRYRYIAKEDMDKKDEEDDEDHKVDLESVDQNLLSELDKQQNQMWQTSPWTEVTFNNSENQFLSTIPLKIHPYSINNAKLLSDVQEQYQFVFICQYIAVEIQICCQFTLVKECMSFWTKYSRVYHVNQNNIVLNDSLRIDEHSNDFVIEQNHVNEEQKQIEKYPTESSYNEDSNHNALDRVSSEPHMMQFNVSRVMSGSVSALEGFNDFECEARRNALLEMCEHHIDDNVIFSSGMVRAWRYDEEQDKWRGRGKGNLFLYQNTAPRQVHIVFKDVKHDNKVRLLQSIDGANEHCKTTLLNEIEWNGNDYSMDPQEPLNSLWKIKFIDEPHKFMDFVLLFNKAVDDLVMVG